MVKYNEIKDTLKDLAIAREDASLIEFLDDMNCFLTQDTNEVYRIMLGESIKRGAFLVTDFLKENRNLFLGDKISRLCGWVEDDATFEKESPAVNQDEMFKNNKDDALFRRISSLGNLGISSLGNLEYGWIPIFDSNDDYQLARRIHVLSSLCMGKHFTSDTVDKDLLLEIFEDIQMCSNVLMSNIVYRDKK